jgi:hypothetical protein
LLIDSSKLLGGQLIWELDQIDGSPALQWIESALQELKGNEKRNYSTTNNRVWIL